MNKLITLFTILSIWSVCSVSANLYGVWQNSNTATFGQINTTTGIPKMTLQFPEFTVWHENSAMNNLTSIMTFVLGYETNPSQFLVSVNIATNKVVYFVDIPEKSMPFGLKYDSDVNSLKCVLKGQSNNTWLIAEMDPASASYDIYGEVQGALLSTGLSTYTHSYYVLIGSFDGQDITMYSYDTRSGQLTNTLNLTLPSNFVGGPYNLLYVPKLDILIANILVKDNQDNVGMDYVVIDTNLGTIKPLGIYQPSQAVSVVSHAAHGTLIYAAVNFDAQLQFVTIDLSQNKQVASQAESTFLVSMGYFTNF